MTSLLEQVRARLYALVQEVVPLRQSVAMNIAREKRLEQRYFAGHELAENDKAELTQVRSEVQQAKHCLAEVEDKARPLKALEFVAEVEEVCRRLMPIQNAAERLSKREIDELKAQVEKLCSTESARLRLYLPPERLQTILQSEFDRHDIDVENLPQMLETLRAEIQKL
jgi:chromosome segregation ATPase